MADNLTTGTSLSTVPSGSVIGTDEVTIGGTLQHVQRIKLVDGTDGGTALIGGDATNGLDVDVTRVQGTVTVTGTGGTFPVTDSGGSLTVDNGGTFAVQADTELTTADLDTGAGTDTRAVVGMVLAASGGGLLVGTANPMPISDNAGSITVDNAGTFAVQASIAAAQTLATVTTVSTVTSVTAIGTSVTPGTSAAHLGKAEDAAAASGDTGVAVFAVRRDTPSSDVSAAGDYATLQVNANGALWVTQTPNTTGGVTVSMTIAANSTNAANVKSTAGSIYGWNCTNEGTAWAYLKFHNTSGTPTAGSGVAYTVGIPPGGGNNESIPDGIPFGTGIGITITAGIAAADTTAVPASKIVVNVRYK